MHNQPREGSCKEKADQKQSYKIVENQEPNTPEGGPQHLADTHFPGPLYRRKRHQTIEPETADKDGNTGEKPESGVYLLLLAVEAGDMIVYELIFESVIGIKTGPCLSNTGKGLTP